MAQYPIRLPKGHIAASIESYINLRFESVAAERMTFSYDVIAKDLAVPLEDVLEVLKPLDGGTEGLMVWRNARRRPRRE